MSTLTINHNLFLTRAERYAWYEGQSIEVIGVSIPVWFSKSITSEPAIEIFCKYRLINVPKNIFIKNANDGYDIQIPSKPEKEYFIPDDLWNKMSKDEKEKWYEDNEPPPTLKMLLDIKDGGSAHLAFRQYSKVRKNKKILNVIHFVEIKDIEELKQTLA